jgi:hypothetical protein
MAVKEGYRLLVVDKDGVLVQEFQLTKNALAQPEAFVAALQKSIESVEEEEP